MKRRSLIASIGVAVAGGAAIGTGAFTSVEADRTISVEIADEDEALLALDSLDVEDNPNTAFVQAGDTQPRSRIRLDFNDVVDNDGRGPGTNSVYEFDRVFGVQNQSARDLFLQTEFNNVEDLEGVGFYIEETADKPIKNDVAVRIRQGHSTTVGVTFDTDSIDVERGDGRFDPQDFDAEITASDETQAETILNEDGEQIDDGGPGA